ncbi:MAG: phosphoribosylformimino-5-aminoimidazole carboxamide ribotide isomerase [Planctomycetota bacterium]|nr:MAG: phosphoribosylformimino-5-aminoimidazole carboxamide ribotide isomerase [Planctomycetota bacterium]
MTVFRPCIDLRAGQVVQIVGGTLGDDPQAVTTNHTSSHDAAWFAQCYARDGLRGGHVIQLGPGNQEAARLALAAYPRGLQVGGGINPENAQGWLDAGASQVIVTSWCFRDGQLDYQRVAELSAAIGPQHLVLDLSCRRRDQGWRVATDRWQTLTDTAVNGPLLARLAPYCAEFLVHAADVEGLCQGIDEDLVRLLGAESPLPVTYAGGARSVEDLALVDRLSAGRVDLTIGSALDIFGGSGARYEDCLAWNAAREQSQGH